MPVWGVTEAAVGVTLTTNAVVLAVDCTQPPPPGVPPPLQPFNSVDRMFTLVDDGGPGQPRALFNFDPFTSPVSPAARLMQAGGGGVPFARLTVKSCPPGSQWTVETT
jgi:hypothetical protein